MLPFRIKIEKVNRNIKRDSIISLSALAKFYQNITVVLNKKVDAIDGKQLSTNDFTNEDKKKLDDMYEKLKKIEQGQSNVLVKVD